MLDRCGESRSPRERQDNCRPRGYYPRSQPRRGPDRAEGGFHAVAGNVPGTYSRTTKRRHSCRLCTTPPERSRNEFKQSKSPCLGRRPPLVRPPDGPHNGGEAAEQLPQTVSHRLSTNHPNRPKGAFATNGPKWFQHADKILHGALLHSMDQRPTRQPKAGHQTPDSLSLLSGCAAPKQRPLQPSVGNGIQQIQNWSMTDLNSSTNQLS
jgi:hypothetical protein